MREVVYLLLMGVSNGDLFTVIASVIGSGGVAAVVVALLRKPLTSAEARSARADGDGRVVDSAVLLVTQLREELDRREALHSKGLAKLEARVERLEQDNARLLRENVALRHHCAALDAQLRKLGHVPQISAVKE